MHTIIVLQQGSIPVKHREKLSEYFLVHSYSAKSVSSDEWGVLVNDKNPHLLLTYINDVAEKGAGHLPDLISKTADLPVLSVLPDGISAIPKWANLALPSPSAEDLIHHIHSLVRLQNEKSAGNLMNPSLSNTSELNHELISSLSHEMRTTVNSISILCRILKVKGSDLPPDITNYIDGIQRSSGTLTNLLNELLDIAKLRSGKLGFTISRVDLSELLSLFERIFAPIAAEKGLHFEIILQSKKEHLQTDALRIEQIIRNLVMNALRYTTEGFVRIRIDDDDDDEYILFRVEDSGPGIPKHKEGQIFERFEQVKEGNTPEEQAGSGLGLYICRELTRYLGGEISLSSTPGEGTTFTVRIPSDSTRELDEQEAKGHIRLTSSPKTTVSQPTSRAGISGTVLIVDDNEIHNVALKEYLGMHIEHCRTATSAREAFDILHSEAIDYMILDMSLPDAEGESVLRQLRDEPMLSELPVIVYTGRSMNPDEQSELHKLAEDVVQKGASSYRKLLESIKKMAGNKA